MTDNAASDLNLNAYLTFARIPLPPLELRTPALKPVLAAFQNNVTTLQNMLLFPGAMAFYSARIQNQCDRAELEVTGRLSKHMPDAPQPPNTDVTEYAQKIILQEAEEESTLFGTSKGTQRTFAATLIGFQMMEFLGRNPGAFIAVQAILYSYVTAMWTIFESLAGDLWEAALNHMPDGLAELQGKKRYKRKGKSRSTDEFAKGEKAVQLRSIWEYGWDTRNHMGSILKKQICVRKSARHQGRL
jgi:hypothetical protein